MIYNDTDTICAVSTPAGRGGIAVIRISGPDAIAIADSVWRGRKLSDTPGHTVRLGEIIDTESHQMLDQGLATVFRAPASFTAQDVVEFAVHGSRYIQRRLLEVLVASGARLAEPGEFTRRAFVGGKLDLAQAEAVADLIDAESRAAHRIASSQMRGHFSERLAFLRDKLLELATLLELELDFSEEDVQFANRSHLIDLTAQVRDETLRLHNSFKGGQAIKEGIPVAIVGAPNAGKSSLLNQLLGDDRAIVSDIPGTTRDTVEDTLALGDYTFRLIDTAGIRQTDDTIEQIGVDRARQTIARARIVIVVSDITVPIDRPILEAASKAVTEGSAAHLIHVLNKADLLSAPTAGEISQTSPDTHISKITISAKTGLGTDALLNALIDAADKDAGTDSDALIVTNARHARLLLEASQAAEQALDELRSGIPSDLVAQSIRATISYLSEITGDIPSSEILETIFKRFCIGK